MKPPKVDAKTRRLIEEAIEANRDGHDILIGDLFAVLDDEDGSEWIWLELRYPLSHRPVDPKKSSDMRLAISDALAADGDLRTVFIVKKFDDHQEIKVAQRA